MDNALEVVNTLGGMLRNNESGGFGLGGGWGIFLLIILFFFGYGNGGWGGNNSTANQVSNDLLFNQMNSTLNQGFTQVANMQYNIGQQLCGGLAGVNNNISENRFTTQLGFNEMSKGIDNINYNNARNTCDIITASNANTQKIIDMIQSDKIDQLRSNLQLTQMELSNNVQTQSLVQALRPFPIPAYPTASPYQALYGNGTCACGV
jgi:hypothetical protein